MNCDEKENNTALDKARLLFELIAFIGMSFYMHNSSIAGNKPLSTIIVLVVISIVLIIPKRESFIMIFGLLLQSNGFFLSTGLLFEVVLVLAFSIRYISSFIFHRKKVSILFAVMLGVLTMNIIHTDLDILFLIRVCSRIMVAYLIIEDSEFLLSERDIISLSNYSFIAIVFIAVYSYIHGVNFWGSGYGPSLFGTVRLGEAYRDHAGADTIGYVLCLVFPIVLQTFYLNRRKIWPIVQTLIMIFIGLLAKTRSFMLCGVIAFIYFYILIYKNRPEYRRKLLLLALCIIIAGGLYISKNSAWLNAFARFDLEYVFTSEGNSRIVIWSKLIDILFSGVFNFLIGVGFDYVNTTGILAHNVPLEILVSWGILGGIMSLLFVIIAFNHLGSQTKRNSAWLYAISFFIAILTIGTITYDKFYIQFALVFLLFRSMACMENSSAS